MNRLIFNKIANNRLNDSMASRLRKKRFNLFIKHISRLPRPIKILDVGGTQIFWELMGFTLEPNVQIVILNIEKIKTNYPNFTSVIADGRKMPFKKEFDVVYSNSAIEHVGDYEQQRMMAEEIKRIGKSFFVQTPYKYFPIEPHAVFPLFQFVPQKIKKIILKRMHPGWYTKGALDSYNDEAIASVRLLSIREMNKFFSPCKIHKEKVLGLTKSLIAFSDD